MVLSFRRRYRVSRPRPQSPGNNLSGFSTTPASGLFIRRVLDGLAAGLGRGLDLDAAHLALDDAAHEIDVEQAVVERRAGDLDAVGEHEGALELARGDAAMEVDAILVVGLLAAHDELIVLDLHAQIVHG